MRLAVSNIAWSTAQDGEIAALLRRYGVDAIDVAPGKYFPQPVQATAEEVARVKDSWARQGFEVTGMQALLFGTTGLNIFGTLESREALFTHLRAICRIGGLLGARRLVFGSPKNRDRSGYGDAEAIEIAAAFFRRVGEVARANGVIVCLEPNPTRYGANFMTTTEEAARVVEIIDHPAIRLQLDTGAMTVNDEDPSQIISRFASFVGHIHASEPDLVPLGDGGTRHDEVSRSLSQYLPHQLVCIEMLETQNETPSHSIERALLVADRHYRTGQSLGSP